MSIVKNKFLLYYLGHAYNDMFFFILPLLLPFLRRELNLDYFHSGLIITIHIGVRSLFSYVSGYFGDKYNKRLIVSFGFIFSSIFLIFLALSQTYITIIFISAIMAVGVATFHPLVTTLVGEQTDFKNRALQIGIFESVGASGIIITSLFFSTFVSELGWRRVCFILAIPGFILAIKYLKISKYKIENKIKDTIFVNKINILLLLIGRGVRALGFGAIMSFLPTYAVDYLHLSEEHSSLVMGLFFFGAIVGNLSVGWFSKNNNILLIIVFSTFSFITAIIGILYSNIILINLFFILFLGISQGGFFTSQNSWLTTYSVQSSRGKVMGGGFLIDGISIAIAPSIFGWLADNLNLLLALNWTILPVFISLLIFIWIYYLELTNNLFLFK